MEELLAAVPLMPLGAGKPMEEMRPKLEALVAPATVRAGLWLAFDFLDESHAISQDIGTPEGSWWHAIMHRREGDFGNAKYWYRRVGEHPAMASLGWKLADALAFVDRCERSDEACRAKAMEEWRALMAWCRHAE